MLTKQGDAQNPHRGEKENNAPRAGLSRKLNLRRRLSDYQTDLDRIDRT